MLRLMQIINYFKQDGLDLKELELEISKISSEEEAEMFLDKYLEYQTPSDAGRLFSIVKRGTFKSAFKIGGLL